MRRKFWLFNRVLLGLVAFIALTALWEFRWKPQYRPYYEEGVQLYRQGKFLEAQQALDRAYAIAPNTVDVIVMEGWSNLRLKRVEEAKYYFTRALRVDPRTKEAQVGLWFIALQTGKAEITPEALASLLKQNASSPDVLFLLADAEERQGNYFKAAQIYSRLESDGNYQKQAHARLEDIFGLHGATDAAIYSFPPFTRPSKLQLEYKVDGKDIKKHQGGDWKKFYVQGVNFGGASPGYYPSSLPTSTSEYTDRLTDVLQLNANALRVYTLLPPGFYRAFNLAADTGQKLSLMQQIWVGDPADQNLFNAEFEDATRAEIRHVIDAIHGRGEVPESLLHAGGIYTFDVADHVSAFFFGRDFDSQVVTRTNALNPDQHAYQGKYVSISEANPTEVWLARMADYIFDYETSTYNWQHPVAIISGAAPDPSSSALLESKLKVGGDCVAGILAAYPAYPFDPDYMEHNALFAKAKDQNGSNPVAGVLRTLRAHLSVPLVVSEYGISTSMQPRHTADSGWRQGGYSEREQAEQLLRLTRSLRETGTSGGLIFELSDEWYRNGGVNAGLSFAGDRAALWLNDLDPAKRYGLLGYRTSKWKLFMGDPAEWSKETTVASASPKTGTDAQELKSLQIAADEGFLYLRLQVAGSPDLQHALYAIALSTTPEFGNKELPFAEAKLDRGANFLMLLQGAKRGDLLVANNYSALIRRDDRQEKSVEPKDASWRMLDAGSFKPLFEDSRDQLLYGVGEPDSVEYDSRAQWYADVKHSAVLVRIPWAKILVTDPSNMMVFAGFDRNGRLRTTPTTGIQVSAFSLSSQGDMKNLKLVSALPGSGAQAQFTWQKWNRVSVAPFRKPAFAAIAREFMKGEEQTGPKARD